MNKADFVGTKKQRYNMLPEYPLKKGENYVEIFIDYWPDAIILDRDEIIRR